jgi:hypothetical protein
VTTASWTSEQRDRVLTLLGEGLSVRQVAAQVGLSKSGVGRIQATARKPPAPEPEAAPEPPAPADAPDETSDAVQDDSGPSPPPRRVAVSALRPLSDEDWVDRRPPGRDLLGRDFPW